MDETTGTARLMATLPEDPFLPSSREDDRIRVIGHRGAPAPGRAENSVPAVTEALRQGADGVEVDVWLTEDDTLVSAHDLSSVADRSALATLPELLATAQQPAGARVIVEAKPVSDAALAARTASVLADVLRASAGNARIIVSSFDPALLTMIRRASADLPVRTALLGEKAAPADAVVRRAYEDGHDEVHLPLVAVRHAPQAVEAARELGLGVSLWTVNSPRDLRWASELGVDAVITDDLAVARATLDRTAAEELAAA